MIGWTRQRSILARFDALSKFFWLFVVGVLAFTQPPLLNLAMYLLLLAIAYGMARLSNRHMLAMIAITLGLGLFFLGGAIWYPQGEPLFQLGPLRITDEGLSIRAANAFRLMNVMLSSFVFVWVTSPRDLVMGFVHLGLPYRIAFAVYVGLNYIPVISDEMGYIRDAQKLRGIRRSNPIEVLRSYPRFLFAVLVRSLRRAQVTAYALDSKGFGAYRERTFINAFRWSRAGVIWLAVWTLLMVVDLYLGYGLGWWQAYFAAG